MTTRQDLWISMQFNFLVPEHKKAIQDTYVAQYKENIAKGTAEIHRNT